MLLVRDYDGDLARFPAPLDPIPLHIEQHLTMDASRTLRMLFEEGAWDSLVSFESGIPTSLNRGMLELDFAPGVNIASQLDRTFRLFNWTGVTLTGSFTVSSPYSWDLSQLYTTGEVMLVGINTLPGDYNADGSVDAADYVVWRKTGGTQNAYHEWRANFGQTAGGAVMSNAAVPEPATAILLVLGAAIGHGRTLTTRLARSKTRLA